jgi:hypothetical protein
MAKAATIAAAIVPATIASKNGIEFRNRRRIKGSFAPTYYLIRPGSRFVAVICGNNASQLICKETFDERTTDGATFNPRF